MDGFEFSINGTNPNCDWFVAFDGPYDQPVTVRCPPNRRILITTEPPPLRFYSKGYVNQFAAIYSCHKRLNFHPGLKLYQQGLPWHIGSHGTDASPLPLTFADFDRLLPDKSKTLSIISSTKTNTRGHRQRLQLVHTLKEHFKDKIDVFGRGIREIPDKWEAIAPYRYHIAIENSAYAHYWTEKLSDAYLGWAFPIYFGCPNISDYFSPDQFTAIDILDAPTAIQKIDEAISVDYEKRIAAIRAARQRVLNKYNMFSLISSHIRNNTDAAQPVEEVTIQPVEHYKSGIYKSVQKVWTLLPTGVKRWIK